MLYTEEGTERTEALWRRRLALELQWRMHQGEETDFHTPSARFQAMLITRALRLAGVYERGKRNACRPQWKDLSLSFPTLPEALDGFRILQLSDLHFRVHDVQFAETLTDFVAGTETDLCVLTGDYRYGYYGPQDHVQKHLCNMLSGVRAHHGIFAVLGNHDLSGLVAPCREKGVHMLINQGAFLSVHDTPIWLGGIDDPHRFRCDSITDALADAPEEAFKILLAHSPERISEAAALGVNLYLCGHTHGGQVRMPFFGPLLVNAQCARAYASGRWQYGSMRGYTTYGLGTTDIPIRYFCPPEAVRITLRRG